MVHAAVASLCVVKGYSVARHACKIRLLCPSGLEAFECSPMHIVAFRLEAMCLLS